MAPSERGLCKAVLSCDDFVAQKNHVAGKQNVVNKKYAIRRLYIMMTDMTRLHTYDPFGYAEVRDWKGREIINSFLYHCIDFEGETYLVQKCEIGDFYSHFERYNDDTEQWHIDGLEVLDSQLEAHVADMWGSALSGVHY